MAIYNPGKYYLVSIDDDNDVCCISHFDVEKVEQRYGDVYSFNPHLLPPTITKIEGQLFGTTRILKAKDLDNVSYEEIMGLIEEATNEQDRDPAR